MQEINPHSTARIAGHPLHPLVCPYPFAFFVSALVTDVIYLSTGRAGFADASAWLLGAGIAMAALAAVLGLTDFLGDRQVRSLRHAWFHMVGNVIAVVLEIINMGLRINGGMAAGVAGAGVILSAIVVLILLFTGWMGWELVYKHHVGISDVAET